ncbi:hypothetical protein ACRALDRAFT_1083636 [Sodiomyces alcalophilus JCM 7366]|uniref:uncharacterized protein n=1 Tax=Sodiomyces alcalophilus JCM 7366 TaxID=591952 RepID=UPI0039B4B192
MFALSPHPPAELDDSLGSFFHQVPRDLRPGNPERPFWDPWQHTISLYGFRCTSEEYHHEKCWGWTILRTSYDDDEAFTQAVAAIHRLALVRLEDEYRESRTRGKPDNDDMNAVNEKLDQVPGHPNLRNSIKKAWNAMVGPARDALPEGEPFTPDWVITHELVRRYHNIVVQDRKALDGADVVEAWEYAHALDLQEREWGARGQFFIYLDKESIHRLAQAPSQEELARMAPDERSKTAWHYWVKAVSTSCQVTEDGDDTDQMLDLPEGRRRLRLYDFFETFIHLCHRSFDQMGIEGYGRERFVWQENREWELCENFQGPFITTYWLTELYGEVSKYAL